MNCLQDRLFLIALGFLAWVFLSPASAADIYRWVDDNGQVHFGARPGGDNAERMKLRATPGAADSGQDQSGAISEQRRIRRQRMLDAFADDRLKKKAAKSESAAKTRALEADCRNLSRHYKDLSYGGPVYYENAEGGRDFLSEQQRQAEKAQLEQLAAKRCRGLGGW